MDSEKASMKSSFICNIPDLGQLHTKVAAGNVLYWEQSGARIQTHEARYGPIFIFGKHSLS